MKTLSPTADAAMNTTGWSFFVGFTRFVSTQSYSGEYDRLDGYEVQQVPPLLHRGSY